MWIYIRFLCIETIIQKLIETLVQDFIVFTIFEKELRFNLTF